MEFVGQHDGINMEPPDPQVKKRQTAVARTKPLFARP